MSKDDGVKILTDKEYIRLGESNLDDCYKVMNMEGWRTEKKCDNGDIVEYLDHPFFGKVFRFTKIDNQTDISYQVAAGGGGGLVSPRDFVNLRHYGMRGASMVCAGQSVEHPLGPETSKYIRGYTRLGCWSLTPLNGGATTEFRWLMSMDMRGLLPRIIVDAAHTTVMIDYARHLRKHCADLAAK
ncbi:steroidogenic acute regulatory protein, mitochondrial [Ctenocephalides felis]|uniref:steroidogenic acute regulatory protein, mitochondrial n=1 Tax=Ctenocephalides felis TaxID=7515 RepID=UPI000E6E33B6|nr:steroidogenic acute regulatory protein, mitochondrial [Ctenocephalides felis]